MNIVYLFVLDWRMALASLVTLPIGFLCYMGMSRGYSERFSGLMKRVQKMNATIIEYVGGIEVIKAFNQSANSYQKYSDAVNDDASYAVDWMKDTQLFMSMSNTIWPSVWLAVLPIGAVLYQHGTLSAPVFLTIMILSLGIVGPILGAIKFTDNISQLGTIVGEVGNLLDAPEMVRPDHDADIHNQSIQFQDVSFSYDLNDSKPILDHIIILDEATSSVDPENEAELQQAIEKLTEDKTVIIIAHRLKTVRNAQQIVVIANGGIAQRGTHQELMTQPGIYADFVNIREKAVNWKISSSKIQQ